jgi:hypothetical protein
MKTITNLQNIAIVVLLSMITTTAMGQNTIRQNRRDADQRRGGNVTERKVQDDDRMKTRRDYTMRSPNEFKDRDHNQRHNSDKYRDRDPRENHGYDRDHKNNYRDKKYNHRHPNHQVHVRKPHHAHRTYYRHLPYKRINRFHLHGADYFHAHNRFYRYHPQFGYYLVDAPFVYVRHLPPGIFLRYINGNGYYFADGMIYLPFENGYLAVPQPEHPIFSLNIVLN